MIETINNTVVVTIPMLHAPILTLLWWISLVAVVFGVRRFWTDAKFDLLKTGVASLILLTTVIVGIPLLFA